MKYAGPYIGTTVFKQPGTKENIENLLPWFFNQLKFIRQPDVEDKVVKGLIRAIKNAEEQFKMAFGGWVPDSNEFGLVPIRPVNCDRGTGLSLTSSDNRWIWTDGTSGSKAWSAADTFIVCTMAENEMMYVYGYFNLEPIPNTIELYIEAGNQKLPILNVDPLQAFDESYFILPNPIIVGPYANLTIYACTRSGTSVTVQEKAGLLGYFLAPNSVLINKTP